MHRFFTAQSNLRQNDFLSLNDPREIHHLKDVLRKKCGDEITVFNDAGEEATAEIIALDTNSVQLKILTYSKISRTPRCKIILACAIPKKAKFETIIEKTTELGVDEIIPVLTTRTEVRLPVDKSRQKIERYRRVAVNAAKQCRRDSIPTIHPPTSFDQVLRTYIDSKMAILIPCLEGDRENIHQVLGTLTTTAYVILIGPEGDFTREELHAAKKAGAIPVSLGETTLKVDTAAISTVAAIRFFTAPPEPDT